MELEPQIAKTIVKHLKDIIHFEINLFDTSGTIIASTDEVRIGTSHSGARLAASSKQTLTIEYDEQFKGAKKGINLPVLFNNTVVAIIGITGEKKEVEPFGNIIKKMTEILIRENWMQITHFNQQMNYSNFINVLLSPTRDESMTAYLASILEIDLTLERYVIYGCFKEEATEEANKNYEGLPHLIYQRIHHYNHSFYTITNHTVTIMMEKMERAALKTLMASLATDIQGKFKQAFGFGIGSIATTIDQLPKSHHEAKIAAQWALADAPQALKCFDELNLELILSAIPPNYTQQFVQNVLGNLNEKEQSEFSTILHTYAKHNGSINKGAEELFIHKNTLQYKLNRLYELTGFNPRNLNDFTILTLAFQLKDLPIQ